MKLMHPTKISLSEKIRKEIINILNQSLADLTDLQTRLKQAHWNVKGMQFYQLHLLFDEIAEEIEEQVDIVAERITSLGGTAIGTLQEAAKITQLDPYPVDIFSAKNHLIRISHSLAQMGEYARENIDKTNELQDMATNDLYIDLARLLDKRLWFIEAHLQDKSK
jgi:starvation-inducible DNA-binding protein